MIASLFGSPGHFTVFLPFSTMLVRMVSLSPSIYIASIPLSKSLETIPSFAFTINISPMFQIILRSKFLSLLSSSIFTILSFGRQSPQYSNFFFTFSLSLFFFFFFFLLIISEFGLMGSFSFFLTDTGLGMYLLVAC